MSYDNDKKPVPATQDTGLPEDVAKELSPEAKAEEIKILAKLDPFFVGRIKHGEYEPLWHVQQHSDVLPPEEIELLLSNPENRGMYTPDEKERQNLMHEARWRQETLKYESFVDEYLHYRLVRHYGNKAVMAHWQGDDMVHQTLAAFKDSQTGRFVARIDPNNGELKRVKLAEALLSSPKLRCYERVEFLPGQDAPPDVLNLWRGWRYREIPDDRSEEPIWCERFLKHVRENVCGGDTEVYEYLLGWMADALQNSRQTSRVALVLRGKQGAGKSLFAELFSELFAPYCLVLNRPEQLTGNFNKHLMDKCIVFADEAFFAGNRQHAASLKTLITGGKLFIEPKGVDGFMAPKYFRLIIASNDEHVVRAENDDRRFLVLNVDAGIHNDSEDYFKPIIDEWRNGGGAAALFHWLRGSHWRNKLESGEWSVGNRPKTRALNAQKDLSLDAPEMAVLNMLREGEPPCEFLAEGDYIFVPTQMLAQEVRLGPKDITALGNALRAVALRDGKGRPMNVRRSIESYQKQCRGFLLPSLAKAREMWESHKGRTVDWPADVVDWAIPKDAF